MTPTRGASTRFVEWLVSRRVLVLVVASVVFAVSAARTVSTYANLRSDLEELLPTHAPSVTALKTLRERLPGLRHLGVVVEMDGPEHVAAASRFLDDLAARVRAYGPDVVEDVRLDASEERAFAETYALQLMDPEDVARLRDAVEERRDFIVGRAAGLDVLEDDTEPPPLPLDELRRKYEQRFGVPPAMSRDGRFVSADGTAAVMLVRVGSHGTGLRADEALLERVRTDVRELGFPGAYDPGLRVGFAGDVPTRVEEMHGLVADLSVSVVVVAALTVLVIVGFFRSRWALPILGIPLALGTFAAFGLVALPPLSIRHLNSNTAFLGSIVVGNGINFGIILLARFREERCNDADVMTATVTAVRETWRPTLAAAAAASAAYGSLIVTGFRGFNQFGWIGGLGMLTCWSSTFVLAPLLLLRWGGKMGTSAPRSRAPSLFRGATLGIAYPRIVLALSVSIALVSVVGVIDRRGDWLETDFSKLRRRDSWVEGERYWGKLMDRTLGRYLTPTVILAKDAEGARRAADRVRRLAAGGGAGDLIATVRDAESILPAHRWASIQEALQLRAVLTPRLEAELAPEDRLRVDAALSARSLVPLEAADLPSAMAAGLRERDGRIDRGVLVFPKLTEGTWDAERMQAYARDLRAAASPDGRVPVAGSLLLSSDLVSAMKHDGPRATEVAVVVVVLVALVTFRSVGFALAALGSLALGVIMMLGVLAWTGQRFNFSNFVALPITFGIGADYSINVLKRLQSEGTWDLRDAITSTGGAVALCSATTVIGFSSLLVAQNQALFSFGLFAVAGELSCLAAAVFSLAAVLMLGRRSGSAAPHAAPGRAT